MKIETIGKPEVPCRAQFDILLAVADGLLTGQSARVTTTNSQPTLQRMKRWLRARRPFLVVEVVCETILVVNPARKPTRSPKP